MEKFELTIVAQGSQSVWVAVIVIALVCVTIIAIAVSRMTVKPSQRAGRMQRRPRGQGQGTSPWKS
jgi:hypothetical protein